MTPIAFTMILLSAVIHASWNMMAKKALDGNTFVWLTSFLILPLYFPFALYTVYADQPHFGPVEITALAGTTVLHLIYFIILQKAYKIGDYTVVYPVARGCGPLLATIGAIFFLKENPSALALTGMLLIVAGVVVICGGTQLFQKSTAKKPVLYGLLTGVCIASYTLWDKYAVSDVGIPPLLLDYFATGFVCLLMTPYVLKNKLKLVEEWRDNRKNVLGVAILSPLSYLIVLYVLISSPVYYVAPLREMSILIAAYLGARILKEGDSLRRAVAALIMFGGVVSLAIG